MKKIMLFAYDGTGLGHLMRLIKIASGLDKFADILIVSGHKAMPDIIPVNLKYFMLPNFYELREEGHLTNEQVNNMRIKLIDGVFKSYNPDVFITDYLPLGKRCELFHVITKSKCLKYFILRSGIGGKELTHEDVFSERNIYFLEKYYDRILYASDPIISPISDFNWLPEKIKELISYVGLVTYHVTEQEIDKELYEDPIETIIITHHPALEIEGWLDRRILKNRNEFRAIL